MLPHSKPLITSKDVESVSRQMATGMLANGSVARDFEAKLLQWTGGSLAVATTSGTAAQVLCLRHLGVGSRDEVIIPTYVCESVERAVRSIGAVPIFCDSGENWNVNRKTVKAAFTSRTKAIISVNIFGIANDLTGLGVPVIEDHCQSFGVSKLKAEAGFYSFHATKCLTTGEGGAAVFWGGNRSEPPTLSDMQAALGISQLEQYESMLNRRREIAARYFAEMPMQFTRLLQPTNSMYFRFPLLMQGGFEKIQDTFAKEGIAVRRGVDALLHRGRLPDDQFPNAVSLFNQTVSIPIYPAMTDADIERVIRVTKSFA